MDISSISDEEKKLLEEMAKAKGKSLNDLLTELGHISSPQADAKIEFEGPAVLLPTAVQSAEPIPRFDDTVQAELEPPPPPMAAEPPPAAQEVAQEEDAEKLAPATFKQICVQCGWDQERPVIPEPEHQDKIAFLHAVLGQKVFSKRYAIFGGNLRLTFRALTIREIDALYREVFQAQKVGLVTTAADYYELLNRFRVDLQLIAMSSTKTALHVSLPEGLTRETCPDAISYWDDFLKEQGVYQPPDPEKADVPTLLMQVHDYILKNVCKTEHLQRAVTHTCNKFNQLIVKMEASVDNADFWKEIEPQS